MMLSCPLFRFRIILVSLLLTLGMICLDYLRLCVHHFDWPYLNCFIVHIQSRRPQYGSGPTQLNVDTLLAKWFAASLPSIMGPIANRLYYPVPIRFSAHIHSSASLHFISAKLTAFKQG